MNRHTTETIDGDGDGSDRDGGGSMRDESVSSHSLSPSPNGCKGWGCGLKSGNLAASSTWVAGPLRENPPVNSNRKPELGAKPRWIRHSDAN